MVAARMVWIQTGGRGGGAKCYYQGKHTHLHAYLLHKDTDIDKDKDKDRDKCYYQGKHTYLHAYHKREKMTLNYLFKMLLKYFFMCLYSASLFTRGSGNLTLTIKEKTYFKCVIKCQVSNKRYQMYNVCDKQYSIVTVCAVLEHDTRGL